MALAQITRNAVYISIHHTIHENIYNYHLSCLPVSDHLFVENFTDLKNIVDAVIMGESDKAKELSRDHVRRFSRHMEKNTLNPSFRAEKAN